MLPKKYYENQVKAPYPTVHIIGEATKNYNCHSYAWYQRSINNKIWIPSANTYMTDGSTVRVNTVTPNVTRVVYGYPTKTFWNLY